MPIPAIIAALMAAMGGGGAAAATGGGGAALGGMGAALGKGAGAPIGALTSKVASPALGINLAGPASTLAKTGGFGPAATAADIYGPAGKIAGPEAQQTAARELASKAPKGGGKGKGGAPLAPIAGGPATEVPQGVAPGSGDNQFNLGQPQQQQGGENPGIPEFMYLRGLPRLSPQMKGQALAQLYRR